MKTPATVIERLRLAMKKRQMNQSQLANALGVTRGTVTYWFRESVNFKINPGYFDAICKCLNIPRAWLIEGKGSIEKIMTNDELDVHITEMLITQPYNVKKSLLFIFKNWKK